MKPSSIFVGAGLVLVAGAYVLGPPVSSTTERRADVAADASKTTHQEAREGNEPVRLRSGVDGEQPPSPALRARLEAARRLPSVEARRAALVEALADAAEREPAATTAIAAGLGPLEGRDEALHETLRHFLRLAPQQAFAFLHDRAARSSGETVLVMAREAATADPALALALAERLAQPLRSSGFAAAYSEWTAVDALEASRSAAQIEDEHDRVAAVAEVARTWAQTDPRASYEWASQFTHIETRGAALEPAIAVWAETDPAAAGRAVASGPRAVGRTRLLDLVAAAWAERDAEAALSWIASLPDANDRDAAATTVLLHLAQTEPAVAAERAARWAASSSANARGGLLDKVLAAWSARAAEDAARWAQTRPTDAPMRTAVATATLERWREQDAPAAQRWLQAHDAR